MDMKCANCGAPMTEAHCSLCQAAMKCENGTCRCEACDHEVPVSEILCDQCVTEA